MAGIRLILALATAFSSLSSVALRAQEMTPAPTANPTPSMRQPRPSEPPGEQRRRPRDGKELRDPRLREMRELFNQLPEDLRQQLIDKTRRWQQMPTDEQAHFRFMRGEREKRTQQAVDDAIAASGQILDEAEKQKFTDIYKRERRKLEESLRAEMDQRRKENLPELQKNVLLIYQKETAAAVTRPTPVASPTP